MVDGTLLSDDDRLWILGRAEELADILAENLEARAKVLRESPTMSALEEEIRLQMSAAAIKGNYGTLLFSYKILRNPILFIYT